MPIEKTKGGGILYPKPGFRAVCKKCSGAGWVGPNEPTRELAEKDYARHMKSWRHR